MTDFIIYFLAVVYGLCIGSFLNVVIYRLPEGMRLDFPSSHCTSCGYKLKWYDNIPVLSYLILGGKCRQCKEHISIRYTLVEIGNALLWYLSVLMFRDNLPYAAVCCAVCSVSLCICCIDFEHLIIYDRFHLILIGLALVAIPFDKSCSHYSHLIGGVVAFGVFYLVAIVGTKVLSKDALGGGDIKLAGAMGFLLGWERMLLAMLIASVLGSIILVILSKVNNESDREYPFGPFLTLGLVVSLLFGQTIISAYISLFI